MESSNADQEEDRVPILGSWRNLYLLVLTNLLLLIFIFYLFTNYFS